MPPDTLPAPLPDRSGARDDLHLIALWLAGCASAHTRSAYARDVASCLAGSGQPPLQGLTLADLQEWRAQLQAQGQAASSINRHLAAVRSLVDFRATYRLPAIQCGGRDQALAAGGSAGGTDSLGTGYFESAPRGRGATPQGQRNQALLQFLYYTGARVAEACGLQWRDLQDLAGERPVVAIHGKGGRTRHVALPLDCARAVAPATGSAGSGISGVSHPLGPGPAARACCQIVRAAAVRAGLTARVSPHWLRHAHASHALDRGAAVHVVQHTLGHASLATTTRYVHVQPGESSGHSLAKLGARL